MKMSLLLFQNQSDTTIINKKLANILESQTSTSEQVKDVLAKTQQTTQYNNDLRIDFIIFHHRTKFEYNPENNPRGWPPWQGLQSLVKIDQKKC